MESPQTPLIGSILERKPRSTPSAPSPKLKFSGKTGFPAVQHRSKSAFARAREGQKRADASRPQQAPVIQPTQKNESPIASGIPAGDPDDMRRQIDQENRRRVEDMTDAEREEERREILERFGPNISDILRKAKERRDASQQQLEVTREEPSEKSVLPLKLERIEAPVASTVSPIAAPQIGRARTASPPSAMSRPGTRPPSRTDRSVRFADVTPNDIHVYESAPPSPRRKAFALPSPTDNDGPTISLGEWKSKTSPFIPRREVKEPESASRSEAQATPIDRLGEGTPEDIRRRFFPTAPAHDPSLAWIELDSTLAPSTSPSSAASALRFDLTGAPISPELSSTLPTHLGLHHHADQDHAGYTLDDLFLLSRSTVPAQRATVLGVLGRIAKKLAKGRRGDSHEGIKELAGQEADLRKRMLAAGVEAMAERGSGGARGVEVIWECIVGWDEEVLGIDGVELYEPPKTESSPSSGAPPTTGDALTALPLDYILPQIASAFAAAALPPESLAQLLAILHRLAQHSNAIASAIVTIPTLVANVLQTFLLTPIPPTESSPLPDPFALRLLATLALASRANASALLGPADALLRFVTTLPLSSSFPLPLATSLLTGTLHLYKVLASYGLYSHIVTTASEYFLQVGRYILSEECQSKQLRKAWLDLLEAWMICAQDPHHTTPSHDILWSQVTVWGWGEEVLEMREKLSEQDGVLWASLWNAEAAWLEGSRVNGVRGGESERTTTINAVKHGFVDGTEQKVVEHAGRTLNDLLSKLATVGVPILQVQDLPALQQLAQHAATLAAVVRLWLSCLPPHLSGPPESPPFLLPFQHLSDLCAALTTHTVWACTFAPGSLSYGHVFYRPVSLLLSRYAQLSRRLPETSEGLWAAQAAAIMCRLLPGDEETAQELVDDILKLMTPQFAGRGGWNVPPVIWEKGGMTVIQPFLSFSLRPHEDLYVGPLSISSASITTATTQRLPPSFLTRPDSRHTQPLPVSTDWMFIPLDHLLRSGESDVFKHMPSSWNASETEVARATLLLAKFIQDALHRFALTGFAMSREEIVFACMKVFMLEHGQQQHDSAEEVFRDAVVSQLMEDIMAPFAARASAASLSLPSPQRPEKNLEVVATRFLGPSTPFYQFYTDFVGLYDAISFAHPLFARLLLPPLSMNYAVDYRKYLWADYSHVLKTVRTPIDSVIVGIIGDYLWPVESDAQVIGSYSRALAKGILDGFPRFIAVHHLACNIWPDLAASDKEKGARLLRALVEQGGFDVTREVVLYKQVKEGTILIPPHCFTQMGEWRSARLVHIRQIGGEALRGRLKNLLEDIH